MTKTEAQVALLKEELRDKNIVQNAMHQDVENIKGDKKRIN